MEQEQGDLAELDEMRDIEDQGDGSVTKDRCARKHLDPGMQLGQRLDYGLVIADDL